MAFILILPAAWPVSAHHVITRGPVFECDNYQFHDPYMDVSRGCPIMLPAMNYGENMDEQIGLLLIRH